MPRLRQLFFPYAGDHKIPVAADGSAFANPDIRVIGKTKAIIPSITIVGFTPK